MGDIEDMVCMWNSMFTITATLTFVACSRVQRLSDILFDPPFAFQRVANLTKSQRLQDRLNEDSRLKHLEEKTIHKSSSTSISSQVSNLSRKDSL